MRDIVERLRDRQEAWEIDGWPAPTCVDAQLDDEAALLIEQLRRERDAAVIKAANNLAAGLVKRDILSEAGEELANILRQYPSSAAVSPEDERAWRYRVDEALANWVDARETVINFR